MGQICRWQGGLESTSLHGLCASIARNDRKCTRKTVSGHKRRRNVHPRWGNCHFECAGMLIRCQCTRDLAVRLTATTVVGPQLCHGALVVRHGRTLTAARVVFTGRPCESSQCGRGCGDQHRQYDGKKPDQHRYTINSNDSQVVIIPCSVKQKVLPQAGSHPDSDVVQTGKSVILVGLGVVEKGGKRLIIKPFNGIS